MRKQLLIIACGLVLLSSCSSENYSNGERIGFITKFSKRGILYKSWEGELNLTQTGMNTSSLFEFSVDNDHEDSNVVKNLLKAADKGYKIKLTYHETYNKNLFSNRGETDHFVSQVDILDSSNVLNSFINHKGATDTTAQGHKDTLVVITLKDARELLHLLKDNQ